jgi:hypothetical protein
MKKGEPFFTTKDTKSTKKGEEVRVRWGSRGEPRALRRPQERL